MTRIGILSDTHGNDRLMQQAADRMKGLGCTLFMHLGDTYRDSRKLMDAGVPVIAVPGNWDPEFTENSIANARADTVGNVTFGLVHDPANLPAHVRAKAHIILTGHTHAATVWRDDGKIMLNPGHLKSAKDKGYPPGFAVVDVDGGTVTCRLHDVEGGILEEKAYVVCPG